MDNAANYVYRPLSSLRSIRLINLLPSADNPQYPIRCSVTEASLEEAPAYEALSYTWAYQDGDRSACRQILVDGLPMLITRNCESALRRVRLPSEPRVVWVDAICIDQRNVEEVNQQVGMMGDIYRKTQQTLIWLGESTEGSKDAFAWLERYAIAKECVQKFKYDYDYSRGSEDELLGMAEKLGVGPSSLRELQAVDNKMFDLLCEWYEQVLHSPYCKLGGHCTSRLGSLKLGLHRRNSQRPPIWSALKDIFAFPWWRRIWVLQEISLPPKALLFCGAFQTDYARLTSVLADELRFDMAQGSSLTAHSYFRKMIHGEEPYLGVTMMPNPFQLFSVAQSSLATDPRDKVYGILGLLQKLDGNKILLPKPDYTQSIATVYTDLAARLVHYTQTVDVILECTGVENNHQIPSWIPNWSEPPLWKWAFTGISRACSLQYPMGEKSGQPPYIKYSFDGQVQTTVGIKTPFVSTADSMLHVHGRPFCTVHRLLDIDQAKDPLDESCCKSYQTWLRLAQSHAALTTQDSATDIFCELASMGWYSGKLCALRQASGLFSLEPMDPSLGEGDWAPHQQGVMSRKEYHHAFTAAFSAWTAMLMRNESLQNIAEETRASKEASGVQAWVARNTKGRVACVTSSGHIGIVPRGSRIGDIIVNMVNVRMPYILRREDGHYRAIGGCYIYEAMHGQGPRIGDAEFEWLSLR